jgi:hypothetical protein
MERKAPPIEALLLVQTRRLTDRTLVASARARTGTTRHDDVAHMVRLANAVSDTLNAAVRLARASQPRPKRVTKTIFREN